MKSDLHIHSLHSDGELSVEEIVEEAQANGVRILSITDHDNIDAQEEAKNLCEKNGIFYISGIEFSTYEERELHILGYNIDYESPQFKEEIKNLKTLRKQRIEKIIEKLERFGIFINRDILNEEFCGRYLIASELIKKRVVYSVSEAFSKYLGENASCYVPSNRLTPQKAIEIINTYNGVSVLAHPAELLNNGKLEKVLKNLKSVGLQGLEIFYGDYNKKTREKLKALADKYSLIATGGSDYHSGKELPIGANNFESEPDLFSKLKIKQTESEID